MSNKTITTKTTQVISEEGICSSCEGSGENWNHDTFRYCGACGGSGEKSKLREITYQEVVISSQCPTEAYEPWCWERGLDPKDPESRRDFDYRAYEQEYYILFEGFRYDDLRHLKENLQVI